MIHKGSIIRVKGNESCFVYRTYKSGSRVWVMSGANESDLCICSIKMSHASIR